MLGGRGSDPGLFAPDAFRPAEAKIIPPTPSLMPCSSELGASSRYYHVPAPWLQSKLLRILLCPQGRAAIDFKAQHVAEVAGF